MQIDDTALPGVKILRPKRFEDERGWFSETFSVNALAEGGISTPFIQDNQSLSRRPGTVRGLHFQTPPFAQAKLVRVLAGAILDVAVDLRRNSPTRGRHVAVELSAANGLQLLVPEGFAHGFVTREPDTIVFYKVSAPYAPAHDAGVRWDDPDLAVGWDLGGLEPVLSAKDKALPYLRAMPDPGF
jgi:dTDP-4-dehydrorhamnose 3,5-epimerase